MAETPERPILPSVDDRDAVALQFVDDDNFIRAMEILHGGSAHGRPYMRGHGRPRAIIINRSDQPFFEGLAYREEKVANPDEVSLEDLARLRHEYMFSDEPFGEEEES